MRRQKNYAGIISLIIFLLLIAGAFFIYSSKMFERNAPKILTENTIYWNLKKPLDILISDDSGVKFANATLSDGKNSIVVANIVYKKPLKEVHFLIKPPKNSFIYKKKHFTLNIQSIDTSKWNFFSGNSTSKKVNIIIDLKRPILYTVNSSYGIRRGGSAIVVFKASDPNLKSLYITTPFGKKFIPTPFYKKDYYISLLAWPIQEKKFRANIIAVDKAGNISRAHIPLFLKANRFRKEKIKIKDSFLNNKIADFISDVAPKISTKPPLEQFIYVENQERKINEDLISKITSKTDTNLIKNFYLKPFHPLSNAAVVAHFGDFRTYYYKGKKITTSYHLGIDLASISRAKIKSSNKGVVAFAKFNGIYGNNILIYHGLGLYSLYGHCSEFLVHEGETVKRGQIIARTGKTGMALGDHLHFGIVVQGITVAPKEWFDRHWMKLNIFNVIKDAKKIIDKK